jgi:hypothetical protein
VNKAAPTPAQVLADAHNRLDRASTAGDVAEAHDLWSRICAVDGEVYKDAVKQEDWASAAAAALDMLIATQRLLPQSPKFLPAMHILDAIQGLIIEAAQGKHGHPILRAREAGDLVKVRGVTGRGSLNGEKVAAVAVACSIYLERLGHPTPAAAVELALKEIGIPGKEGRVRRWRSEADVRPFLGSAADLADAIALSPEGRAVRSLGDAEHLIHGKLRQAFAEWPSLAPI